MSDAHTAAKALLLAACRDSTVAAAAAIGSIEWVSRVLTGDKDGFVSGLHRGRLPAVEVFQRSDKWTNLSQSDGGQGTMSAAWTLRVHSGQLDQSLAEEQCRAIVYAALIKIRENQYFWVGDEIVAGFDESPLGFSMTVDIDVVTVASRDSYESAPNTPGGTIPDGGTMGGISKQIEWNDASPVSILALPAGQALAGVQVTVVVPFNGTAPSISIGVDGDQSRHFDASEIDLTTTDVVFDKDVNDSGPQTIKVWIVPGAGALAGRIKVQLLATASS